VLTAVTSGIVLIIGLFFICGSAFNLFTDKSISNVARALMMGVQIPLIIRIISQFLKTPKRAKALFKKKLNNVDHNFIFYEADNYIRACLEMPYAKMISSLDVKTNEWSLKLTIENYETEKRNSNQDRYLLTYEAIFEALAVREHLINTSNAKVRENEEFELE
jgi:hypothetical protein